MSTVNEGPPEGQDPVTSTFTPEVARAWLSGLRAAIADVQAAVEDEQRPHRERRLGHLEAVRITREGFLAIEKALSCAERGLALIAPARS